MCVDGWARKICSPKVATAVDRTPSKYSDEKRRKTVVVSIHMEKENAEKWI